MAESEEKLLKEEVNNLKAHMAGMQLQFADFSKKLEESTRKIEDSNKESHTIKHDLKGMTANMQGMLDLFRRNETSLSQIKDTLLSSQYEKRIIELEKYIDQQKEIFTMDTARQMVKDIAINSEFRSSQQARWQSYLNIGAVAGIITAVITALMLLGKFLK